MGAKPFVGLRMRRREPGPGRRIFGVDLDGLTKHLATVVEIGARHAVQALPAAQVTLVDVGCRLRAAHRPLLAPRERAAAQRRGHGFGDLVLDREYVAELAIEALRPLVVAGGDVDELHRDAQPVARLAHAALEQRADAELASDFARIEPRAAKLERGAARRDAQAVDVRERIDQFFRETLAKIVLVAPRTHVGEWQHANGRGARGRLGASKHALWRLAGRDLGGEAVATPVARLDEPGVLRVVAQRLAQFLDAGDERIVADHSAAPHMREQFFLAHRLSRAREQCAQHRRSFQCELDLAFPEPQSRGLGLEAKTVEIDGCGHIPAKSRK